MRFFSSSCITLTFSYFGLRFSALGKHERCCDSCASLCRWCFQIHAPPLKSSVWVAGPAGATLIPSSSHPAPSSAGARSSFRRLLLRPPPLLCWVLLVSCVSSLMRGPLSLWPQWCQYVWVYLVWVFLYSLQSFTFSFCLYWPFLTSFAS